jgi:hypothetical protein
MNENRKTFDYDVLWNEVRERVLNRELPSVKERLALYDDEKFENLRKSFEPIIKVMMNSYGDFDSPPTFGLTLDNLVLGLCLENFRNRLGKYLEDCNLSSLPTVEAMIITDVWCDIILDSKQQNTVD